MIGAKLALIQTAAYIVVWIMGYIAGIDSSAEKAHRHRRNRS